MTTPDYPTTARTTLTTLPDENTKDMVQQAHDKAKVEAKRQEHESSGYALALLESAGIKETAVTVSAARFSHLSDETKAYICNRPAWDMTVNYKNVDKTENISNFGKGVITMVMKYTPASNEITDNLAVVYVPGGSNPQILANSSYDNRWTIWQRSDLTVCGVGYITPDTTFTNFIDKKHLLNPNRCFLL